MSKKITDQLWHLLGSPWKHPQDQDSTILAGSNDPHTATLVATVHASEDGDGLTPQEAYEAAMHITELHNQAMKGKK